VDTQQALRVSAPVLIGAFVLFFIQVAKTDIVPVSFPARWRPMTAVVLGLVSTIAGQVVMGREWGQAVVDGLMGGLGAVGGYEFFSRMTKPPTTGDKGGSGPSEKLGDGPKVTPDQETSPRALDGARRWLLVGLTALFLAGCGVDATKLQGAVKDSSLVINAGVPCLMGQRDAALQRCLLKDTDEARRGCVASVQSVWSGIVEALGRFRDFRCEVEPAKCEPKDETTVTVTESP
jgi:hypothetical protein